MKFSRQVSIVSLPGVNRFPLPAYYDYDCYYQSTLSLPLSFALAFHKARKLLQRVLVTLEKSGGKRGIYLQPVCFANRPARRMPVIKFYAELEAATNTRRSMRRQIRGTTIFITSLRCAI